MTNPRTWNWTELILTLAKQPAEKMGARYVQRYHLGTILELSPVNPEYYSRHWGLVSEIANQHGVSVLHSDCNVYLIRDFIPEQMKLFS